MENSFENGENGAGYLKEDPPTDMYIDLDNADGLPTSEDSEDHDWGDCEAEMLYYLSCSACHTIPSTPKHYICKNGHIMCLRCGDLFKYCPFGHDWNNVCRGKPGLVIAPDFYLQLTTHHCDDDGSCPCWKNSSGGKLKGMKLEDLDPKNNIEFEEQTNRMTHYKNGETTSGGDETRVFLGPYVHSDSRNNPFDLCSNGVIGVKNGKIIFVDINDNLDLLKKKFSFSSDDVQVLGQGEFLMPGLVDTHIHAPQYPNAGLGLDLPLLEWLTKYTFPMETRFADVPFARLCYKKVVTRTLNCGTTTASYYASIHKAATEVLADMVDISGQRAFIGKVNMDCYSPDFYIESTKESLKATEDFIISIKKRKNPRVQPIITPRFALCCSEELMTGLGSLAEKYNVHIQTHLCESLPEIERALELFPNCKNYTEIYEKMGLLSDKSIMAHCVHMTDEEILMLKKHSSGVAHCPISNMCLLSGFSPVRKLLDAGVNVGLGTDVSGGYTASILEVMRSAIITSKCLKINDPDYQYEALTFKDVFYLATLGGAEALAIGDQIGNFKVGKSFDALHIDLNASGSPIHIMPEDQLLDMVQKFIMIGDDRNIAQVYVEGKIVKNPMQPLLLT